MHFIINQLIQNVILIPVLIFQSLFLFIFRLIHLVRFCPCVLIQSCDLLYIYSVRCLYASPKQIQKQCSSLLPTVIFFFSWRLQFVTNGLLCDSIETSLQLLKLQVLKHAVWETILPKPNNSKTLNQTLQQLV